MTSHRGSVRQFAARLAERYAIPVCLCAQPKESERVMVGPIAYVRCARCSGAVTRERKP
jgi:hypothetical protein